MSLKIVCSEKMVKNWWFFSRYLHCKLVVFPKALHTEKQDVTANNTRYRVFAKQVKTALQIVEAKLFSICLKIKICQKMAPYATDGAKHNV